MHFTKPCSPFRPARIQWLSDLHLDRATSRQQSRLLNELASDDYDAAVITGDVTSAPFLDEHLGMLAAAIAPRPVYMVLGNHDFHRGSFIQVRAEIARICRTTPNLRHLGRGDIVALDQNTALVGHDGWADGRAGWGSRTVIHSRDHHSIEDFRNLTTPELFKRMGELGRESAAAFRATLPLALRRFRHVVVLTHVPPFPTAAHYDGMPCDAVHVPHFSNLTAGLALIGLARTSSRHITVLAGHTHHRVRQRILPSLEIRVAGALTGQPEVQGILDLATIR